MVRSGYALPERSEQLFETKLRLRGELRRDPGSAELAAALGMTEAELENLRQSAEPIRFESLDETYADNESVFADDRPDAFAILADEELRENLAVAISTLPDRLQLIVQLYFLEELNLSEMVETIGVSVPRIHQLKAQAIDRLRAALAGVAEII